MNKYATRWIDCSCYDTEHAIRLAYYPNDTVREVTLEASMSPCLPWYKRVRLAFKYIFTKEHTPCYFGWSCLDHDFDLYKDLLAAIELGLKEHCPKCKSTAMEFPPDGIAGHCIDCGWPESGDPGCG